jgi:hypothetical protein
VLCNGSGIFPSEQLNKYQIEFRSQPVFLASASLPQTNRYQCFRDFLSPLGGAVIAVPCGRDSAASQSIRRMLKQR